MLIFSSFCSVGIDDHARLIRVRGDEAFILPLQTFIGQRRRQKCFRESFMNYETLQINSEVPGSGDFFEGHKDGLLTVPVPNAFKRRRSACLTE